MAEAPRPWVRGSQVRPALLLAVMVELVLPVHQVGEAPAVELGLPLALGLAQRVCSSVLRRSGRMDPA